MAAPQAHGRSSRSLSFDASEDSKLTGLHAQLIKAPVVYGVGVLFLAILAISVSYIAFVVAGIFPGHWPGSSATTEPAIGVLPVDLMRATVQVGASFASYSTLMPWTKHAYSHAGGIYGAPGAGTSGVVVDRTQKLILTGDFVASDVSKIWAVSTTNTQQFDAEVLLVAEDIHLALVRVNDDKFWKDFGDTPPMKFSTELPPVSTPVQISGYFAGQTAVAVQSATVSQLQFGQTDTLRLGRSQYAGGFYAKVHPQPDKTFNPGPVFSLHNPTGPALGFMAVVVGNSYFVPGPVIHRMLAEYHSSGKWGGMVTLPALLRDMEAKPMRDFWQLDGGKSQAKKEPMLGIQVRSIAPNSGLEEAGVKKGDVLVRIDGYPVHPDGTIPFKVGGHDFMFPLGAALAQKRVGDTVKLEVLRPSEASPTSGAKKAPTHMEISVKLAPPDPLIRRLSSGGHAPGQGKAPSFFSVAGLVFTTLTQDLLKEFAAEKENAMVQIPSETLAQVIRQWRENPDDEVVIFLRGMENRCNAHYMLDYSRVLTHFNGKEVKSLKGLLQDVGAAVAQFQGRAQKSLAKGTAPEVGTGCEENGDFLEFTWLPDANKDTGGSAHGDADMVLMTGCAQESTIPGMAKWVNNYGALPFSPDLVDTWSSSMLGGKNMADMFGGPERAAMLLPTYFGPALKDGRKKVQNELPKGSSFLETEEEVVLPVLAGDVQGSSFLETEEEVVPAGDAQGLKSSQLAQSSSLLETLGDMTPPSPLEQLRGYAWSPSMKAPASNSGVKLPDIEFEGDQVQEAKMDNMDSAQQESRLRGGLLETKSDVASMKPNTDAKPVPAQTNKVEIQSHEHDKEKSSTPKVQSNVIHPSESKNKLRTAAKNKLPMNNVVRIDSVNSPNSYIAPWMPSGESGARCSGIVLDSTARFILTCAHCVGDSKMLFVSREDFPQKTIARVVEVAHDMDLAWLTADNSNGFWDHVEHPSYPVEKEMPGYGSEVQVVGYPIGGTAITQTKGVVARVDAMIYPNGMNQGYRNAASNLLVFQVDAAINPGNSGGPAFNNHGELLGLAFAGLNGAQNVGYVIPNTVVQNFVQAVVRGGQQWVAQTDFGVRVKPMQNPSLRQYWGLGPEEHGKGVQIRTVAPLSGLKKAGLRKTDVLLAIDGHDVTDNGKVSFKTNEGQVLVDLDILVTQKQRVLAGGESALREKQAIGPNELFGKHGNHQDPHGGLPMPLAIAGATPGKNQTAPAENGVMSGSSGTSGGPGPLVGSKPSAPSWSKPNELKYVPTNVLLQRRECVNGKAKTSRVPLSMNLMPVPPLVPRFDDAAVGIRPDDIGERAAQQLGFAATPSYYVVGGFVWSVLSQPLVNSIRSAGASLPHSTSLCMYRWRRSATTNTADPDAEKALGDCGTETDQVVVLLRGLDHKVNENYGKSLIRVLRYVNNEPVVSLKGLIGQVAKSFQANNPYLTFTFAALEDGEDVSGTGEDPDIVLNAAEVMKTGDEILAEYGLQSPVSEDLLPDYQKAMAPLNSATAKK